MAYQRIGLVDVTGSVAPSPTNSDTDVSGNLNTRRSVEKRLYNRLLVGDALKTEVGESLAIGDSNKKATPPSWTQDRAGLRHGFVIAGLSSSLHELQLNAFVSGSTPLESSAVPASATMFYGKSQLVTKMYKLTGSDNMWPLDEFGNPIQGGDYFLTDPVTGSLFGRFNYTPDPDDLVIEVSDSGTLVDIKVWVELVTRFTHVVTDAGAFAEDSFNLYSGPYPSNNSLPAEHFFFPTSQSIDLQRMSIYLQPPSSPLREEIGPRFAYPSWNDPDGIASLKSIDSFFIDRQNPAPPTYPAMGKTFDPLATPRNSENSRASIWDGRYILWEGKNSFLDASDWTWGVNLSQTLAPSTPGLTFVRGSSSFYQGYSALTGAYVNWDTDFNIRTIFCDSSPNPNPLHLGRLYNFNSSSLSIAPVTVLSGGSPNESALKVYSGSFATLTASAYGNQFPWFVDKRLTGSLGSLQASASIQISGWNAIGFPPAGWLTGDRYIVTQSFMAGFSDPNRYDVAALKAEASGFNYGVIEDDGTGDLYYRWYAHSASDNEWPTQGRNLGPDTIRPVMPLLDDLYTETVYRHPLSYDNDPYSRTGGVLGVKSTLSQNTVLRGFRPGLRGTQINGKWKLIVAMPTDFYNGLMRYQGYYFRQWRLELTYEQNVGVSESSIISRRRKHMKQAAGRKAGKRLVQVLSGSRAFPFHFGVEKYYVIDSEEYGRTVGIVSDTGTVGDFAVFTRVTGTLADRHTGSAGFFSSFLGNEFGTPYIPISSGSGDPTSLQIFSDQVLQKQESSAIHELVSPRTLVPKANTIKSALARSDYSKSTAERVKQGLLRFRSELSGSG